jgi:hypothetical protein
MLTMAKKRKMVNARFLAKKPPHRKERDMRMPTARRIKTKKTLRSTTFPSWYASDADLAAQPNHCEGSREATMNIQVNGTHKAVETSESLAGSKDSIATRKINHSNSAKDGGIR